MNSYTTQLISTQAPKQRPSTEQSRQRLVSMAIGLTQDTPLAPTPYERMLLDQFVRGNLTIDQVLRHLAYKEHE